MSGKNKKETLDLSGRIWFRLIRFLLPKQKLKRRFKRCAYRKYLDKSLPFIYSQEDTIKLLKEGYSLARIGDGELLYIFDKAFILPFQSYNEDLKDALVKVLKSENSEKLLVGILNPKTPFSYLAEFYLEFWEHVNKLLNYNTKYADSSITREYSLVKDAKTKNCRLDVQKIDSMKEIWKNRRVVFVYSTKGRFYIEPRLFGEIIEAKHIDIPAVDAFNEYDKILMEAKSYSLDYLFLIAGGPTATVLAYDLAHAGYQAIDIGHLPNSYQHILNESVIPEQLPISK